MFRTAIATYINTNLQKHGLSAKKVAAIAQIPDSTFSNYKTGKIEHPNEEQLFRIAAVFGDAAGHRVILSPKARVNGTTVEQVLQDILKSVPLPKIEG